MQVTPLEELQQAYSDIFKDVNGCRPPASFWIGRSEQELDAMIERLHEEYVEVRRLEEERTRETIAAFEKRIDEVISMGAKDRATALKWLFEGAECATYDRDYFCYRTGLPYGYLDNETI